jgi:hypothetical protein
MASEFSFDVVSRVDITEVKNAIDQAEKEIAGRYDFRQSITAFDLDEESIKVTSDDEFRLNMAMDVLRSKLSKRNVSLKALEYGKIEQGTKGSARQTITLKQGVPVDEGKRIVRDIKAAGIKANAQIQGDQLRISSKDKDALQLVQRLIKGIEDLTFDPEFANYR